MVLLVTADTMFAAQVTDVLTRAHCAVLIARDMHDAIGAVDRLRPDVLLLDDRSGVKPASGAGLPELVRRTTRVGTRGFIIRAGDGVPIDTPRLPDVAAWPVLSRSAIGADVAAALDHAMSRPGIGESAGLELR